MSSDRRDVCGSATALPHRHLPHSQSPNRSPQHSVAHRPHRERVRGRRAWLLRQATDSQARLQITAERSASKHSRGSRNPGEARPRRSRGLGTGRSAATMAGDADGCAIGEQQVRHLDACETRIHGRAGAEPGTPPWLDVSGGRRLVDAGTSLGHDSLFRGSRGRWTSCEDSGLVASNEPTSAEGLSDERGTAGLTPSPASIASPHRLPDRCCGPGVSRPVCRSWRRTEPAARCRQSVGSSALPMWSCTNWDRTIRAWPGGLTR